ncbi:O-antigen ligase family protein [Pseudolysinimonas sp.]|uniref:O-antigen ligase family protein n=1 Tax=Pseudolysinimonas sp. TaxID=2680009 RepID=UPI003F806DC3
MPEATLYRRTIATLGLFTLTAGDFWRYSLTWYGWGAIVLVLLILGIIEIVRARVDLRRLPLTLVAFLALMLVSTIWSNYPGWTLLGTLASLITTTFGVFLATTMSLTDFLRSFGTALRWILGLSLVFELFVALVIRHHILPLWVAYCDPSKKIPNACYWSRDLLLHGGQIQGIVGNSNLLALAAMFALIVFLVQFVARSGSRLWLGVWIIVALLTLALTRSSTVMAATAVALLVGAFLLLVRRARSRVRTGLYVGGAAVLVAGIAVVVLAWHPLLKLLGKSSDLTFRTVIWRTVIEKALERPVGGWGWVSYWVPWLKPYDGLIEHGGINYLQAHEAWLDVFLQLGVVGLIVFGIFVVVTLLRAWTTAIDAAPGTGLVRLFPVVVLVALLVHSLAESRLLIEIGFTLLVVVTITVSRKSPAP